MGSCQGFTRPLTSIAAKAGETPTNKRSCASNTSYLTLSLRSTLFKLPRAPSREMRTCLRATVEFYKR